MTTWLREVLERQRKWVKKVGKTTSVANRPDFPVLEIVSFVDAYTAVLVGDNSEIVEQGDELYVLGIGFSTIPKVNLPLISPKAQLEATRRG